MKSKAKLFLILFFLVVSSVESFAATSSFREKLATVMFAGIGGAVLGLSTLSFYGEPQERIGNITTGFVLGLVGGSVYVASQAAAPIESAALRPYVPVVFHKQPLFVAEFTF